MSHIPQRSERDCLNCGTYVVGKYCHECGQQNLEPKESVRHLVVHVFEDLTHFDGKFFTSIKDLLLKPGFLSLEYMKGRRARYLHPLRMYLFTSFIFFLIFFSFYKIDESNFIKIDNSKKGNKTDIANTGVLSVDKSGKLLPKENSKRDPGDTAVIQILSRKYQSRKEYDSALKAGKKYNWFENKIILKNIELNEKYRTRPVSFASDIFTRVLHFIPQMLFILLPLFALFLKLLYLRRKNFYYTDHAIFTFHFYIFVFIDMLVILGVSKLSALAGFGWLRYVNVLLMLILFYYLYKAMRNFYKQSRLKTILKYLFLLFSFFFAGLFLFIIFILISVFQI